MALTMTEDITERRVNSLDLANQVKANRESIENLSKKVDEMQSELAPMSQFFEDIETLARVGRCFRFVMVSTAAVLTSVAAIWAILQGWFKTPPVN